MGNIQFFFVRKDASCQLSRKRSREEKSNGDEQKF